MDKLPDANDLNLNPEHVSVNMESFQFVWLDAHFNTSTSALNARRYRKFIIELNTAVQFFTEPLKCLNFMKTIKKEKIILITSGSLAEIVLSDIHPYAPLSAVFIFCLNRNHYTNLLAKYKKILDIFVDRDSLLESIKKTIDKLEEQVFSIISFDLNNHRRTPNLSKEYISFLWPQLFINVLRNMPFDDDEKNEFSDKCEAYYRNNETEMNNIADFRAHYTPDKSIEWYTKNTFLYKVINKALRWDSIDLIYSFPFFVNDLCHQLEIEKQNLIETDVLILYRGITVPNTQIKFYEDMNGKLVLTKGFSSTTRNRDIALRFAGQDPNADPLADNDVGVLFEIRADPREKVLFADIANRSFYKREEEVLFGPNTTFHVDSVAFDPTNRCLKINMRARDVFNDCLYQYFRLEQEETRNYQPFALLGRLLFDKLGKIKQAERYFKMLLRKLPSDHDNIPAIYCQLGDLNLSQKNYDVAVDSYNRAMKFYKHHSKDYSDIVDCLLKMADAYLSKEQVSRIVEVTQQALFCGKQAMEMLDKTFSEDLARRAKIHHMLGKAYLIPGKIFHNSGKIYSAKVELDKVDKHLQTAYMIFTDIIPLENVHLVSILSDMSELEEINGDSLMARKLLRKQIRLAEKYLPLDHPKQGVYLEDFVRLYELHGLRDAAMKVAWQRLTKYQESFSEIHPIIAQTLMSIGSYDKACRILFQIEPIDEDNITRCLREISLRKHLHKRNIELFQKWYDYLKQNYPTTEHRLADVLCQFANIYNDMEKFDLAFTCVQQSLPIYRHHQDHLRLRTVEDFMRHIEQGTGRLHIANIVCDDSWQNGYLFLGTPNELRAVSAPPVQPNIRPTISQIRLALMKT